MSELPPLDERCRELTADLGSEEGDSDVMVRLILDCRHRQLSVALEHLREVDDFLIGWDMAAGDKGYKAALDDYVTMELKAHDDPAVSAVAAERERELSEKNARIEELEDDRCGNASRWRAVLDAREVSESKLRAVSDVLKEIPVVAQYEFHEGWLECYSIASVDFFVARLRAIVEGK